MQHFANDLKHSKYLFESALDQLDSKGRLCISLIFFQYHYVKKQKKWMLLHAYPTWMFSQKKEIKWLKEIWS